MKNLLALQRLLNRQDLHLQRIPCHVSYNSICLQTEALLEFHHSGLCARTKGAIDLPRIAAQDPEPILEKTNILPFTPILHQHRFLLSPPTGASANCYEFANSYTNKENSLLLETAGKIFFVLFRFFCQIAIHFPPKHCIIFAIIDSIEVTRLFWTSQE